MLATLRSIALARQHQPPHKQPQQHLRSASSTTADEPQFYPLAPPPTCDTAADAYSAAVDVAARLRKAGHPAVIAGGWVRDTLLLQQHEEEDQERARPAPPPPADVDLAVAAPRKEILRLFGHATDLPRGTLRLYHMGHAIEVSRLGAGPEGQFFDRGGDGEQEEEDDEPPPPPPPPSPPPTSDDAPSPSLLLPLDEMRYSAAHRDFTVNALFYDPVSSRRVVDFVGGVGDLRRKTLRLVSSGGGDNDNDDAARRLAEDPLRCLRGVRFAAQLGLALDPATARHIREHADLCGPAGGAVPARRAKLELRKLACGASAAGAGGAAAGAERVARAWPSAVRLMYHLGLLRALFPWLGSDADARRATLAAAALHSEGAGAGADADAAATSVVVPLPQELRVAGLVNPSGGREAYDALELYYDAPEERANVSVAALAAELARGEEMGGGGAGGDGSDDDDDHNDDGHNDQDLRWARVYAHEHGAVILATMRAWMQSGLVRAAFDARHERRAAWCERCGATAEARAALARERAAREAAEAQAQEEEWRLPGRGRRRGGGW
jgi:tRNA nucleotidyltransferase/poly(A) polymerase